MVAVSNHNQQQQQQRSTQRNGNPSKPMAMSTRSTSEMAIRQNRWQCQRGQHQSEPSMASLHQWPIFEPVTAAAAYICDNIATHSNPLLLAMVGYIQPTRIEWTEFCTSYSTLPVQCTGSMEHCTTLLHQLCWRFHLPHHQVLLIMIKRVSSPAQ